MSDDTARRLAEALREALLGRANRHYDAEVEHVTAALLPVVRELGDLRAAEELEAAGEDLERPRKGWRGLLDLASHADIERAGYARWLRARAAALRGEAGR